MLGRLEFSDLPKIEQEAIHKRNYWLGVQQSLAIELERVVAPAERAAVAQQYVAACNALDAAYADLEATLTVRLRTLRQLSER